MESLERTVNSKPVSISLGNLVLRLSLGLCESGYRHGVGSTEIRCGGLTNAMCGYKITLGGPVGSAAS